MENHIYNSFGVKLSPEKEKYVKDLPEFKKLHTRIKRAAFTPLGISLEMLQRYPEWHQVEKKAKEAQHMPLWQLASPKKSHGLTSPAMYHHRPSNAVVPPPRKSSLANLATLIRPRKSSLRGGKRHTKSKSQKRRKSKRKTTKRKH